LKRNVLEFAGIYILPGLGNIPPLLLFPTKFNFAFIWVPSCLASLGGKHQQAATGELPQKQKFISN
jgi:hypothetical protein